MIVAACKTRYRSGMKLSPLILVLLCSLPMASWAVEVIYDDHIYEPQIRTVQFYRGQNEMSYPILYMRDQTALTIEFDELTPPDGDISDFWVRVISCTANWEQSELLDYEYLDGYYNDRLLDWTESRNTRIHYFHYRYTFPIRTLPLPNLGIISWSCTGKTRMTL